MGREREAGAKGRYLGIRLGAVFALALGVAFVLWLVLRNHDGSTAARTTTTTQSTVVGPKRTIVQGLTAPTLKSRAAISDRPIYWIGAQAGTKYEFTQTPDGKIFIRYLPRSVAVGDRKGRYTIVGTYPVPNALRAVQTAAKEPGAQTFRLARGGLAVLNAKAPTNVYFAYPGTSQQIEVYDPNPARARRLVQSGAVRPIG